MSREQAMADILAASTSTEMLGSNVLIDGVTYQAVKGELTSEEMQAMAVVWNVMEGVRLSISIDVLGRQPAIGSCLSVDNKKYEVNRSQLSGRLLKMTLIRSMG